MEWYDQGILLQSRPHGESAAILDVFTSGHGLCSGVVRGGTSRQTRAFLQPGAQIDITWRARLQDHMGVFTVEPVRSRSAQILESKETLMATRTLIAMLLFALPERQPFERLYERTFGLMDLLGQHDLWPLAYVQWELLLLEELGFALDLSQCTVTGTRDAELCYISPRTGKAVSLTGAGAWADRLLPLPRCLLGDGDGSVSDLAAGFRVTGYFLTRHIAGEMKQKPLPSARATFVEMITRPHMAPPER